MYVPNYIPDPIEIPGNVTQEPYLFRLGYIRRVSLLHMISLLAVAAVAYSPIELPGFATWWPLAVIVCGLAIVRVLLRRTPQEASVSVLLLLPLLASVGLALRPLVLADWPLWSLLLGPFCAVLYAGFCGRDFSFMGQYLLSMIASSTAIAAFWAAEPSSIAFPISVLAINILYLTYWVYDLASLLARRRRGEELAAVVDLYRDVLNIFGYVVRCVGHWKKHRIWVIPR